MVKTMYQVATMTRECANKALFRSEEEVLLFDNRVPWYLRTFFSKQDAINWGFKQAYRTDEVLLVRELLVYIDDDGFMTVPQLDKLDWIAL